jgi:dTDP-4-dehydrorhamnose reductase
MIYLLGGSGYVGQTYQRFLKSRGIAYKNFQRRDCDYTDVRVLKDLLKANKPDFLINAAGYTGKPNVDACESDKTNCLFGNAILPGRIAEACDAAGIPWGHVSSGCIYTGTREDGTGFTEADAPNFSFRQNNCSFYSGTKALGEEVLKQFENVYIWRLRIPFDNRDNPRNYLSKLIRYDRLLEATNSISELNEFVAATFACWEKKIPYGIYNVTNPGAIRTREVAAWIQESGVCTKEFSFFDSEDAFMQTAAKTPRSNCVLSSGKLAAAGILLTPTTEAVKRSLSLWESNSKS